MRLKDFNETFDYELRDPEFAAGYLECALEDGGVETFLIALRDVARANGGMSNVAQSTALNRESMYRALSENGNPEFRTVQSVLKALGMRIAIKLDVAQAA